MAEAGTAQSPPAGLPAAPLGRCWSCETCILQPASPELLETSWHRTTTCVPAGTVICEGEETGGQCEEGPRAAHPQEEQTWAETVGRDQRPLEGSSWKSEVPQGATVWKPLRGDRNHPWARWKASVGRRHVGGPGILEELVLRVSNKLVPSGNPKARALRSSLSLVSGYSCSREQFFSISHVFQFSELALSQEHQVLNLTTFLFYTLSASERLVYSTGLTLVIFSTLFHSHSQPMSPR